MDNKSIANDLYQAAVISVLAVGYSILGKQILKMTPPSVQTEDLTRSYKRTSEALKMASVAMLIGGALANALAFTGSSYLFHRLSADNIDAERKRHDVATEVIQKAQIEWTHNRQQRIDFIYKQLRLEGKFTELNDAM